MARNCWATPTEMTGFGGSTDRKAITADVIVRLVLTVVVFELSELFLSDEVAVIVTVPGEIPVTMPLLLIVATAGFDEVQVTSVVMSLLL